MLEFDLTIARIENEDPSVSAFRIVRLLENRPQPLILIDEPNCTWPRIEAAFEQVQLPATDMPLPIRCVARRLKLDPKATSYDTEIRLPKLLKRRSDRLEPTQIASIIEQLLPTTPNPLIDILDPKTRKSRVDAL
jgi:hypothetical protein